MQKRRKCSQEYKLEAVRVVQQSGIPRSRIAHNLGINSNMLPRWCKQFDEPDKTVSPGQELARLKRVPQQVKRDAIFTPKGTW